MTVDIERFLLTNEIVLLYNGVSGYVTYIQEPGYNNIATAFPLNEHVSLKGRNSFNGGLNG
jgi:hypothetical protein